MRIFFSVGEPSGDLHGANLIKDLRAKDPTIEAVGFGGPKMAEAGCQLHFELTSLAVMGILNVLKHIRKFFALKAQADEYFQNNEVDAVVLIDYPGFNWHIARKAKKNGIPVYYYGVPQMWAWMPWRVRKLKRLVDHVLCKLPFEEAWFRQRGCQATYIGHPYFDESVRYEMDHVFKSQFDDSGNQLLVLLPGSRTQEVQNNLPDMLLAAKRVVEQVPRTRVVVASFKQSQAEFTLQSIDAAGLQANVFVGKTPELIASADACIACSGSVSLELLHHRKPTVVVYRLSRVAMTLQRIMIKTRFITLVNMFGREHIEKSLTPKYNPNIKDSDVPMPEYMGSHQYSSDVADWIISWFTDPAVRARQVKLLDDLADQFAKPGASKQAATYILDSLDDSSSKSLVSAEFPHSKAA